MGTPAPASMPWVLLSWMRSLILSNVSLSIPPNSWAMSSIFAFIVAISSSLERITLSFSRTVCSRCSSASSSLSRRLWTVCSRSEILSTSCSCIASYCRVIALVISTVPRCSSSSFEFISLYCSSYFLDTAMASVEASVRSRSWSWSDVHFMLSCETWSSKESLPPSSPPPSPLPFFAPFFPFFGGMTQETSPQPRDSVPRRR
mmetsp:Transcript_28560/g.83574  ORF Transcript_28560/g.83574 Transcript_28560/m.83574 type:complete len:203 (+) Transcript_28560:215-823(+)